MLSKKSDLLGGHPRTFKPHGRLRQLFIIILLFGAAMSFVLNRRGFLGAGTGLAVNASFATVSANPARGEANQHTRNRSLDQIDRTFLSAVEEKKVAGVVAIAATEKEILYQGSFGKRDAANAAFERGIYDA